MAGNAKKGECPPGSGRQTFLERTLGVIVREKRCAPTSLTSHTSLWQVIFTAQIAVAILSSAGIAVERAEDGRQCVDMLCNFPAGHYDMILMDIQMPIMDGYEAARIIRRLPDERLAHIPIIAMTANAFAEGRKRAISAGMNAHVAKPVGIDTLRSVMSDILARHGA